MVHHNFCGDRFKRCQTHKLCHHLMLPDYPGGANRGIFGSDFMSMLVSAAFLESLKPTEEYALILNFYCSSLSCA